MRIAFAITKLFPGGGLQRDCVEIAREVRRRGHDVVVFTTAKEGDFADDLAVAVLPAKRRTNHGRQAEFAALLRQAAAPRRTSISWSASTSSSTSTFCTAPILLSGREC